MDKVETKVFDDDPELEPGMYSAFVVLDGNTWEQPTYRVPAGWSETEFARAIEADYGRQVLMVVGIGYDPDCPEEDARELPDLRRQ